MQSSWLENPRILRPIHQHPHLTIWPAQYIYCQFARNSWLTSQSPWVHLEGSKSLPQGVQVTWVGISIWKTLANEQWVFV